MRGLGAVAVALAALLAARTVLADEALAKDCSDTPRAAVALSPPSPTLLWDETIPRFRLSEYVVSAIVGPAAIAEYTWLPSQASPHWVGGILFDDDVRSALRLHSIHAEEVAWTLANVVGVSEVAITVGIDSIIVPIARGSLDVAWQLTMIDIESYSLGSIVTISLYDTVGRTRPSYAACQSDPTAPGCTISPTASFPSGHTTEAFIAAGLSCANHAYVPIYASRFFDALACARDLTLATTDGVLRIMGDRHYATDALTGAAIGFTAGFALPVILHYGYQGRTGHRRGFALVPSGRGVGLRGSF
jgi:membrane-associated phospholipid phosphatase